MADVRTVPLKARIAAWLWDLIGHRILEATQPVWEAEAAAEPELWNDWRDPTEQAMEDAYWHGYDDGMMERDANQRGADMVNDVRTERERLVLDGHAFEVAVDVMFGQGAERLDRIAVWETIQAYLAAADLLSEEGAPDGPRVVCLCGSTRFIDVMAVAAWECEKAGDIALSCHLLPDWYEGVEADHQAEKEGVAADLDRLHLRKIDLADEVLVIDVDGYIGESTRNEIAYAEHAGKPVRYWSQDRYLGPVQEAPDEDRNPEEVSPGTLEARGYER